MPHISLQRRFSHLPGAPPDAVLQLTEGARADYEALAGFHYRSSRPATMTRVLALRDPTPSVAGRYLGRAEAARTAAVLVESLPSMACRLRDLALGGRYRAGGPGLLNREVRCISRVVVHPQWRGLGLAVRLVRHALATATTPVTESLAAMGHVHPFFALAGMAAYHRPAHAADARLADALRSAGFDLLQLAHPRKLAQAIADSPHAALLARELARWRRTLARGGADDEDAAATLVRARRRLLCEPVYFVKAGGRE